MSDGEHKALFQNLLNRVMGSRKPYHAYTRAFDLVTEASGLNGAIGTLKGEAVTLLREAMQDYAVGLASRRAGLRASGDEAAARLSEILSPEERAATVVTLLLDQSGSMRGRRMLCAAAALDICHQFLRSLGVKVEVLGFTTRQWHGGEARRQWRARGMPRDPGRLSELLHIVYRSAEDEQAMGEEDLRGMLRSDLLKENIDGEALEWAIERLRRRPETRKLLLIVSDGAPVDDATLLENGPNYLQDHLTQVISAIQDNADVWLGAVGLEHRVDQLYARSVTAEDANALGPVMLSLLEAMLAETALTQLGSKPPPSAEPCP